MEFEENWSLNECREIAADVALHMGKDQTAFGAFDGGKHSCIWNYLLFCYIAAGG